MTISSTIQQAERLRRGARRIAHNVAIAYSSRRARQRGSFFDFPRTGTARTLRSLLAEHGGRYWLRRPKVSGQTMLAFGHGAAPPRPGRDIRSCRRDCRRRRLAFPPNGKKGARHLHIGSVDRSRFRNGQSSLRRDPPRARRDNQFDPNIRPLVTPDRDSVALIREREVSRRIWSRLARKDSGLYPNPRGDGGSLAAMGKVPVRNLVVATRASAGILQLGIGAIEVPARM